MRQPSRHNGSCIIDEALIFPANLLHNDTICQALQCSWAIPEYVAEPRRGIQPRYSLITFPSFAAPSIIRPHCALDWSRHRFSLNVYEKLTPRWRTKGNGTFDPAHAQSIRKSFPIQQTCERSLWIEKTWANEHFDTHSNQKDSTLLANGRTDLFSRRVRFSSLMGCPIFFSLLIKYFISHNLNIFYIIQKSWNVENTFCYYFFIFFQPTFVCTMYIENNEVRTAAMLIIWQISVLVLDGTTNN